MLLSQASAKCTSLCCLLSAGCPAEYCWDWAKCLACLSAPQMPDTIRSRYAWARVIPSARCAVTVQGVFARACGLQQPLGACCEAGQHAWGRERDLEPAAARAGRGQHCTAAPHHPARTLQRCRYAQGPERRCNSMQKDTPLQIKLIWLLLSFCHHECQSAGPDYNGTGRPTEGVLFRQRRPVSMRPTGPLSTAA